MVQQNFKPTTPLSARDVHATDDTSFFGHSISNLVEQLQKFLDSQPNVWSAYPKIGLTSSNSSSISFHIWILDSGASHHMSSNLKSCVLTSCITYIFYDC